MKECISKNAMGRKEIISWRLKNMLEMAKEINKSQNLVSTLAENNQYLRICGEKFEVVGVCETA